MYKAAQACHAYHSLEGQNRTIFYEEGSSDLSLRLLFCTRRDAEDFQNELTNFSFLHPHFSKKLDLQQEITEVEMTQNPIRVVFDHYNSGDNEDSPKMSLNDILIASPSASVITLGRNLECQLQALEDEHFIAMFDSKWYKCHLVSAANKKYANDPDNCIYASWNFHQLFDGLNTETGIGVIVRYESHEPAMEVQVGEGKFERRYKVIVSVTFKATSSALLFSVMFKIGTEKIDEYTYKSFLYFRDANKAKEFLDHKAKISDTSLENMSSVSNDP